MGSVDWPGLVMVQERLGRPVYGENCRFLGEILISPFGRRYVDIESVFLSREFTQPMSTQEFETTFGTQGQLDLRWIRENIPSLLYSWDSYMQTA